MARLTTDELKGLTKKFMERVSNDREPVTITKAQLFGAVDGLDTWLNDNQQAINIALPVAARTSLTSRQKRELFMLLVMYRLNVEG